jgi:hypothetical protein
MPISNKVHRTCSCYYFVLFGIVAVVFAVCFFAFGITEIVTKVQSSSSKRKSRVHSAENDLVGRQVYYGTNKQYRRN